MNIIYTGHARDQMKRRHISRDEVETTIRQPEIESPGKPPPRVVLRRHVGTRFIKVVIVREDDVVVITTAVAGEED